MIQSRHDYLYYLEADRVALGVGVQKGIKGWLKFLLFPDYVWRFQRLLRKVEYYQNCKSGIHNQIWKLLLLRKFRRRSAALGLTIPPNVCGPGLSIAHIGTIVLNPKARIGANCRIHVCVNIGTDAGHRHSAPQIGDNCYIGPGAKLYGDITIGDGVAIGANAVVNKSFTENGVALAGVPAKVVTTTDTYNYVIPGSQIVKAGLHKDPTLEGVPAKELREKLKNNPAIYT